MATLAVLGKGVQLKRSNNNSPETFTAIPEMLDVPEAPSSTKDLVDVTNHDSGDNREFILGLGDGNEITCLCNYIHDQTQDALRTDKLNNVHQNFQLEFPQLGSPSLVASFTALVRSWTLETPINEAIKLSFTLKISGDVSWN